MVRLVSLAMDSIELFPILNPYACQPPRGPRTSTTRKWAGMSKDRLSIENSAIPPAGDQAPQTESRLYADPNATTPHSSRLIAGALRRMTPFGPIPFRNTLPALALLLLAAGLLQRDGACTLLGHLVNVATILYFGLLIAGEGVLIHELLRHLPGLPA